MPNTSTRRSLLAFVFIFSLVTSYVPFEVFNTRSVPEAQADITSGLVGHWKFDNTTNDSAGTNNGTAQGGPTYTIGKLGQALDFDSTDDYVLVPNTTSIDTDNFNGLTISAWINPRSHGEGTDGRIADKSHNASATHDGWVFDVTDSGGERKLRFIADHSTTDLFRRSATGVWNLNTWQHVLVTWDKSTAAANVHIYVNGIEVAYDQTTDGAGTFGDTRDLYIGNAHNVARTFDGFLDDVRIYNRVLSVTDISELYNYTGADTTKPTVSITDPTDGSTVADTVPFSANASDNVGVTQVEFFVDGVSKGVDTSSPYSIQWDTTNGGSHPCNGAHTHTLTAVASDQAGNQTTSAPITVNMNDPSYCATSLPTYTVLKTGTVPVIDGNLSEYASANAITMSGGNGNTTNLKMMWDNTNLYLGATITDTELNALVTTHDTSGIWNDDSLEFVFDTQNNGGWDTGDYKIIVNARHCPRELWKTTGNPVSLCMSKTSESLAVLGNSL